MKFELDDGKVLDGTIMIFGIRYQEVSKIFTYAMLKAGGLWYLTGTGRVPVGAGWSAVQRWLDRDGREVVWVKAVTGYRQIWPDITDQDR